MTLVSTIARNRFGLGARPGEGRLADPQGWLLAQFDRFETRPAAIAGLPGSAAMTAELKDYRQELRDTRRAPTPAATGSNRGAAEPAAPDSGEPAARRFIRSQLRDGYGRQVQARLAAALVTPAPFAERLVHFWANHFAVSADKLVTLGLAGTLEFEAIRPHVAGRFGDLLGAVLRHPAMLLYLDQAQSIGPGSQLGSAARRFAARKQPGLNENLAREVLELHTLGVGNYGQDDVLELARALTGWSIGGFVDRRFGTPAPMGAFVFQSGWHEPGERRLLGRSYRQAGEAQAAAMLDDLALHPATARHLATKLARHFVADTPPPALVERLAAVYLKAGGALLPVYRELVMAPEAWAVPLAKFKTPWDWTVSALRAIGSERVTDLRPVAALGELGQPAWRPGSPAGWDDVAASWAAPDALLRRVEIAGRIAAAVGDRIDARALAPQLLAGVVSPDTVAAVARADSPGQGLALFLASPEFLRR